MIKNHDRSGWFGASDTQRIMGPWTSPSFARWWAVKLGLVRESWSTLAMRTGTAFEHPILEHLGITMTDRQIKLRPLRLRVNLDGENAEIIHEVKTHGKARFVVTRGYWEQCQVEQFAARKACRIVAYRLEKEDYKNWLRSIDDKRLSFHPVPYDGGWVDGAYLPRLEYLAWCLRRGAFPNEADL